MVMEIPCYDPNAFQGESEPGQHMNSMFAVPNAPPNNRFGAESFSLSFNDIRKVIEEGRRRIKNGTALLVRY